MKKRFIIALNSTSNAQDAALKQYLQDMEVGWWHWIDKLWLVSDKRGKLTASKLRDDLGEIFPGVRKIVFELRGKDDTWSGVGPKQGDRNMFDWLKNNWKN